MKTPDYTPEIDAAIDAILKVSFGLIGVEDKARQLILALCDQAGVSLKDQKAIAAILETKPLETK